MKNKKFIIIAAIILTIIVFYQIFLKDNNQKVVLIEVVRGDIAYEIFESGQILRGERVNLAFQNPGRIEKIYVQMGDEIKRGQELAKLDTTDLNFQLQEAKIVLELAQLNMSKLLAGATQEEIKISEAQAENARIALKAAEKNLQNSHATALVVLDGSYSYIYNTLDFLKELIRQYVVYDEGGRRIMGTRDEIAEAEKEAKLYLDEAKKDLTNTENVDKAVLIMKKSLETSFNGLETIIKIIDESDIYQNNIPAANRTSLDTLKSSINSALASVVGAQQTIFSAKSGVNTAKTNLEEAENRLILTTSQARQIDIDLYQAQIRQAESRVKLYENKIQQSKIISPISGKVAEVKKEAGELAQPSAQDAVIVVLPLIPYEIRVDIYEEDIIKIDIGNEVEISLIAFPGKTFRGRIVSINPAEKVIGGVVYYETVIAFDEEPDQIRPGMTADIIISSYARENVLIINREATKRQDGKTIVEVFKDGLIEEREVEVGIRGIDNMVEIISGLKEGEKVIQR